MLCVGDHAHGGNDMVIEIAVILRTHVQSVVKGSGCRSVAYTALLVLSCLSGSARPTMAQTDAPPGPAVSIFRDQIDIVWKLERLEESYKCQVNGKERDMPPGAVGVHCDRRVSMIIDDSIEDKATTAYPTISRRFVKIRETGVYGPKDALASKA